MKLDRGGHKHRAVKTTDGLVREDRRIAVSQVAEMPDVSCGSAHAVLQNTAKCVPDETADRSA